MSRPLCVSPLGEERRSSRVLSPAPGARSRRRAGRCRGCGARAVSNTRLSGEPVDELDGETGVGEGRPVLARRAAAHPLKAGRRLRWPRSGRLVHHARHVAALFPSHADVIPYPPSPLLQDALVSSSELVLVDFRLSKNIRERPAGPRELLADPGAVTDRERSALAPEHRHRAHRSRQPRDARWLRVPAGGSSLRFSISGQPTNSAGLREDSPLPTRAGGLISTPTGKVEIPDGGSASGLRWAKRVRRGLGREIRCGVAGGGIHHAAGGVTRVAR